MLVTLPHDGTAALLPTGGELKGPSHEHMTTFLQVCAQVDEGGGDGREENAAIRVLVDSARCRLQLLKEHSQDEGLKQLVEMFKNNVI